MVIEQHCQAGRVPFIFMYGCVVSAGMGGRGSLIAGEVPTTGCVSNISSTSVHLCVDLNSGWAGAG